jgi:hypothetical protein
LPEEDVSTLETYVEVDNAFKELSQKKGIGDQDV